MTSDLSMWPLAVATLCFLAANALFPRARRGARSPRAVPVMRIINHREDDRDEAARHAGRSEGPSGPPVALHDISYDVDALPEEPTEQTSAFRLECAARTDRGLCRKHNEDRLLLLEKEHVFVVADGMGGHAGGALASELAVSAIARTVFGGDGHQTAGHSDRIPAQAAALVTAIGAANEAVRRTADADDRFADMGTTVVAARFCPRKRRLYVGHVGDSRCYRLRGGKLRQITLDHTMGALGVTGPSAQHLSRAVGTRDRVEPDITVLRPEAGDVYLLCSDGLTKMMGDDAIAAVVAGSVDAEHAVEELVRGANERGGKDNVTAIVVRVIAKAA